MRIAFGCLLAGLLWVLPSTGEAQSKGDMADKLMSIMMNKKPAFQWPKWMPDSVRKIEFMEMLTAILNGSMMGPGDGWFRPSQSRYSWEWLAKKHQITLVGSIKLDKFQGSKELFKRLDRNGNGELKADDFDWSENSPYYNQLYAVWPIIRLGDADKNGTLSKEEWNELFDKLKSEQDRIAIDDVRKLFFPPPAPRTGNPMEGMPTPKILLKGLFDFELGSPMAGPAVNEPAPDFSLKTFDGKKTITLSEFQNKKPVVLIFGSFT